MTFIKENFSIKDLENLSGIKAHTIRIWEQRYSLLQPNRSDSNIRTYSVTELLKLLSIKILRDNNVKISKIANLSEEEISEKLLKLTTFKDNYFGNQTNELLVAMLSFDVLKFHSIFNHCRTKYSFEDIFLNVFIPLFERIGMLWQTNSIQPAHEYFISNLVRQKLYVEIENVKIIKPEDEAHLHVVLLPLNEIHDLGSLFLHYQLSSWGKNVVYLGPNVSEKSLSALSELQKGKTSYFIYGTIYPLTDDIPEFVQKIKSLLQKDDTMILAGRKAIEIRELCKLDPKIKVLDSLLDLKQAIS
ncbi:MAG: MerR family transcriptional regulator [Putridiphycobacter sp.]|nr:MerR family transcriptional regulator [Putridiphycobacter sp.]